MTALEQQDDYADIRDAVAKLCAQFPGEYWRKLDREMDYPQRIRRCADPGRLSLGADPRRIWRRRAETIGRGRDPGRNPARRMQWRRLPCPDVHHGHACCGTAATEQKAKWLPKIASGELRLQAFGVTEPTSGTDTSSLKTFAKRDGNNSYVVNGQKIWTSRAEYSDLMILLARTTPKEQAQKRTDGLSVFIVDMREAKGQGLEIRPIRTMMNHATTEVFFTDMKVPAENLIGEEGKGFRYILSGMNAERILIASECIGDAKWFIAKATNYAKERAVFGRPIGQNQGIQFPIAKAYAVDARRRTDGEGSHPQIRGRARLRRGGQHGQDAGGRRRPGKRRMPACRPMAASASPRNTTSSANSARRGSTRSRRSRPIWCCPSSPSMCSACPAPTRGERNRDHGTAA